MSGIYANLYFKPSFMYRYNDEDNKMFKSECEAYLKYISENVDDNYDCNSCINRGTCDQKTSRE